MRIKRSIEFKKPVKVLRVCNVQTLFKGDVSHCSHTIWKAVECFVPLHEFPYPAAYSHCNVCVVVQFLLWNNLFLNWDKIV